MAKGRELKGRIKSVENTRKITRTMEMVATSKMKRAQDRVVAARPYANALADVISSLYSPELAERFPLLRQPAQQRRVALIVLTSNRGLAGGFNANLIKQARAQIAELERAGAKVDVHVIGKKGIGYFKYVGRELASQRIDVTDRPTAENAAEIVDALMAAYIAGELDGVYVTYSKFNSVLNTPPTTDQILPVTPPKAKEGGDAARLSALPERGSDSHRAASVVRAQCRVSRARRDRGGRAVGAPHRNEERDGQRRRHSQRPSPHL